MIKDKFKTRPFSAKRLYRAKIGSSPRNDRRAGRGSDFARGLARVRIIHTRTSGKTDLEGARPFGGASRQMFTGHLSFTNAAMGKVGERYFV